MKLRKFSSPSDARRFLVDLGKTAETAGVTVPQLDQALEAVEHARRFVAARTEARDDRTATVTRLAERVLDDELDLDSLAVAAIASDAWADHTSTAYKVVDAAEKMAVQRAVALVAEAAGDDDGPLFAELRDGVAATITEVRKLRSIIDDVRDDQAARKAGPKVAAAWSKYRTELTPRWDALHLLAGTLRSVGAFGAPLPADLDPLEHRYARAWAAAEDRHSARLAGRPRPAELLDEITDEWQPGGPYTADEIAAHRATQAAEQAPTPDDLDTHLRRQGLDPRVARRAQFA